MQSSNNPRNRRSRSGKGTSAVSKKRVFGRVSYSESKGFRQTWRAVPKPAFDYTESVLGGFDESSKALFRHVLSSARLWTRQDAPYWVPMPSNLLRKEFRNADLIGLTVAGLLVPRFFGDGRTYSRAMHKSREFAPDLDVLRHFQFAIEEGGGDVVVNLFTGKPTTRRAKHRKKDKTGNSEPKLLRDAWDRVVPCPFDRSAAEEVIEQRRLERIRATMDYASALMTLLGWETLDRIERLQGVTKWEKLSEAIREHLKGDEKAGSDFKRLRENLLQAAGRLSNDQACLDAIVRENACRPVSGGLWESQEAYSASGTGRSTAAGGAFQNASRELKQAMIGRLPNVFNYDMESSQDRILLEFFGEAGIQCDWLEAGLRGTDFKQDIVAKTGLSRETVKRCLHALKMGASVRKRKGDSLFDYIREEVGESAAGAALERFVESVRPLLDALAAWHYYLTGPWIKANAYRANRNRRYVRNAVGKSFPIDGRERGQLGRKLAAHLLQGRESQFLHHLVLLSDRYGFDVLSLQHDGLITRGEIPEDAVEEVRRLTGMHYVRLLQKDFV